MTSRIFTYPPVQKNWGPFLFPDISERHACRVLRVARSALHRPGVSRAPYGLNGGWSSKPWTPRPRAKRLRSRAFQSNQRGAMDVTHIPCGRDAWGHLTAVIGCHDRELIGYKFALRGRGKEAERAIEAACLRRCDTLRPTDRTPILRSDNGLIF